MEVEPLYSEEFGVVVHHRSRDELSGEVRLSSSMEPFCELEAVVLDQADVPGDTLQALPFDASSVKLLWRGFLRCILCFLEILFVLASSISSTAVPWRSSLSDISPPPYVVYLLRRLIYILFVRIFCGIIIDNTNNII